MVAAIVCGVVSTAMPVAHAEAPAAVASVAPAEPAGMQQLFDGKDLDGWDGDPRLWSVRDGVIHGETTPENVTAESVVNVRPMPPRSMPVVNVRAPVSTASPRVTSPPSVTALASV